MGARRGDFDSKAVSAMTWLFSPGTLRELALRGRSPAFGRLARATCLESRLPGGDGAPLRELFEAAYSVLKRGENRCAYVYKNVLAQKRFLGIHSLETASLLPEFRVGTSKADVVILNGSSTAYEIKSERDSLARLGGQLRSYVSVFDSVYVVSGENHVERLEAAIPDEVGILIVDGAMHVSTRRKAISNKARILPGVLFDSLTRREAEDVLGLYGIRIPELPNTRVRGALKEAFLELGPVRAHDGAVAVLKRSRSLSPLRDYLAALPPSLKAAGLGARLPAVARERFVASLSIGLREAYGWV